MDTDLAEQFRQMGATVSISEKRDEGAFEVWSCNWDSVTAFLACETQWRAAAGLAGLVWIGLDYSAVDVLLRRISAPDHVFADLQIMEHAALQAFREAN